jgi:hypothetical protein
VPVSVTKGAVLNNLYECVCAVFMTLDLHPKRYIQCVRKVRNKLDKTAPITEKHPRRGQPRFQKVHVVEYVT